MASSRVVNQFIRQRRLLFFNLSTTSSCSFKYPLSITRISYSSQKTPVKTEQSESENQVQIGFAEVGKLFKILF